VGVEEATVEDNQPKSFAADFRRWTPIKQVSREFRESTQIKNEVMNAVFRVNSRRFFDAICQLLVG
jgi:hypothetical protein